MSNDLKQRWEDAKNFLLQQHSKYRETGGNDGVRLDFSDTDLRGALFNSSLLQGASFNRSVLRGATFDGADLTEASVSHAKCHAVKFIDSDFVRSDFSGSDLRIVSLRDAKLRATYRSKRQKGRSLG